MQQVLEDQKKTKESVMDFPPQSPDRNPTEHLWEHLSTEKVKNSVTSQEALVKSCWDNMGRVCFTQTCGEHASWSALLSLNQKRGKPKY